MSINGVYIAIVAGNLTYMQASKTAFVYSTSKEPVCPRVELILKIIIIILLLIIFLGFINRYVSQLPGSAKRSGGIRVFSCRVGSNTYSDVINLHIRIKV